MIYVMYSIASSKKYVIAAGASGAKSTVTTVGLDAVDFWKENKTWMIVPTVGNVLGMVLLSLYYVMG